MNATAFHIGQQKQLNTVLTRFHIKWLVIRQLKRPQASLHRSTEIPEMSKRRSSRRADDLSTGLFKVIRGVNEASLKMESWFFSSQKWRPSGGRSYVEAWSTDVTKIGDMDEDEPTLYQSNVVHDKRTSVASMRFRMISHLTTTLGLNAPSVQLRRIRDETRRESCRTFDDGKEDGWPGAGESSGKDGCWWSNVKLRQDKEARQSAFSSSPSLKDKRLQIFTLFCSDIMCCSNTTAFYNCKHLTKQDLPLPLQNDDSNAFLWRHIVINTMFLFYIPLYTTLLLRA